MHSIQSAWIINLALRLAAIVCLGVLAVGLILGVEPLTALMRSTVAFVAFVVLGRAVAAVWDVAPPLSEGPETTLEAVGEAMADDADTRATVTGVPDEAPAGA
jgi:uncharacterized membrane protein YqjE